MSNPSFANIDRWLFELVEGNLTPEQEAQLKAFLLLHPELEIDLDAWEEAFVHTEPVEFGDTRSMQKRRPIGVYMSLGFSFMVALIAVGIFSRYTDIEGAYVIAELKKSNLSLEKYPSVTKTDNYSQLTPHGGEGDRFSIPTERVTSSDNTLEEHSAFVYEEVNTDLAHVDAMPFTESEQSKCVLSAAETKFQTQKARQLTTQQFSAAVNVSLVSQNSVPHKKFAKSTYHRSLSTRFHYMGRALERMLDNPIALRNQNDPYYHVPGMQATDINFGAVGTLLATRVQTVTRAQWLGMGNQQWMNQVSVDGYSYAMRGGIGFQVNQNYYADGSIQNYHSALTYSPKFSISRDVVLEPSVRFKMGSKQLNAFKINSGETVEYDRMNQQQFNSVGAAPHGRTLWYRDLGLGLMINTRWFYAGIQQDNLFRHFDNIYSSDLSSPRRAPKHFVACIGSDYKSARQKITISPYLVYQKEDQLSEAWAGFNFKWYWLTVGGAISSNLDPAASTGIKLKKCMLQYNLDLTRSTMLNKQLLSHQLTLRFTTKAGRVGQRLLN